MDPVSLIVLAGGGIYASKVLRETDAKTPVKTAVLPSWAAAIKSAQGKAITPTSTRASAQGVKNPYVVTTGSTFKATQNKDPGHPKEIVDAVTAKAKAAYDKLSSDAKAKACAKLKAMYPNDAAIQQIPCPASWQKVMTGIAAAGGTAACVATGAGAAVSPLCGIAAAWITSWAGPKLEEWSKDAYNASKDWVEGAASTVKNKVVGGVESAWHSITPW